MSWMTALATAIGPVSNMVGRWQERRSQVAQASHEARLERIRSQRGDFKDEVVLFIVLYPVVSMFIPIEFLQQNTFVAFEKMGKLPEWYVGLYAGICMAVFGIQAIPKIRK